MVGAVTDSTGSVAPVAKVTVTNKDAGLVSPACQRRKARGIPNLSVEPFHLFRHLDEQCFRFNNRKMTDGERFSIAVAGIVGKRVTFDQLTGKRAGAQA